MADTADVTSRTSVGRPLNVTITNHTELQKRQVVERLIGQMFLEHFHTISRTRTTCNIVIGTIAVINSLRAVLGSTW
jgi:hypothetical protein